MSLLVLTALLVSAVPSAQDAQAISAATDASLESDIVDTAPAEERDVLGPALLTGGFAGQAMFMGQGLLLTAAYARAGFIPGQIPIDLVAFFLFAAPVVALVVAAVAAVFAYTPDGGWVVPLVVGVAAGLGSLFVGGAGTLIAGLVITTYQTNDTAAVVAAVAVISAATLIPAVVVGGVTTAATAAARAVE